MDYLRVMPLAFSPIGKKKKPMNYKLLCLPTLVSSFDVVVYTRNCSRRVPMGLRIVLKIMQKDIKD